MMKRLLVIALAFFLGSIAYAQDPKAKDILDDLSAKTKSYSSITADFTINLDNRKDKVKDTQQGKLILKGSMFKIVMKASDIYSNGRVKWTYLKESNEVNVQNVNPNDPNVMNNPSKLFNAYLTDFKYTYKGLKKDGGVQTHQIDLYPKDLKAAYSMVRLFIDTNTNLPKSVIYSGKDGVSYTIKFNKITANQPVSNSEFVFNEKAHPGVEVIDMR